jgi:tetratricopeptide (TPR) repeat protein
MNFEELNRQLPSKQRSIVDLARYVQTRADDNANYNLLLGAGCSINSGIRSANRLVEIWRQEILNSIDGGQAVLNQPAEFQRDFLKSHHSEWYDPTREYSSLFERRYDLQRQRRMFVESEVANAFPSIGYAYLTSLVAKGFFRNIFTTNFDDLLNEAFYSFSSERPIVCAQDSSIGSITVTSKRPKVIKLHGDYLFDDLKATIRETESLESNMKAKFVEFAKEAGFIVVGYSGADRSVMDIFSTLLKNDDYLRGGIYWCLRADSEIPEELRRLFWRDRTYYVQIDGFDELFAELYTKSHQDEVLPSSLTTTARPSGVTERLLASKSAIPDTTEILRKAKAKLSSLTKRSAIASLMVHSSNEERPAIRGQVDDLTDDELLVLTEAANQISDGKYQNAIDKLNSALRLDCRALYRRRLLREQIQAFRLKGDNLAALSVLEQLITMNPGRGSNHLLQANIESNEGRKRAAIEKAIEVEPFLAGATLELARWHIRASRKYVGEERKKSLHTAHGLLEKCLELSPTIANPAWTNLFELIGELEKNNNAERLKGQQAIIDRMSKQNPESFWVLSKRLTMAINEKDNAATQKIIDVISGVERRIGLESAPWIAGLKFGAYSSLSDGPAIDALHAECERLDLLHQDTELAYKAARAIRNTLGDEARSERILTESLKQWDFDAEVFEALFDQYIDLQKIGCAEKLLADWGHLVVNSMRLQLLTNLLEAKGEYAKALATVKEREIQSGSPMTFEEVYLNLCAGNFQVAERLSREILLRSNFSPEACPEIVNYELARKSQGKKPDITRLEAVLRVTSDSATHAAIYCLLGRKPEMIKAIKEQYSIDRRFKYTFTRWPVFVEVQGDREVLAIFR